jgi:glycosyltransferase involved in cell wall biosynthesis
MFLSMGLPVLAERTPAYEELAARTGGVVFVASDEEWCHAINNILNQHYRATLLGDAASKVRKLLDISIIGERWFDCLSELLVRKAL